MWTPVTEDQIHQAVNDARQQRLGLSIVGQGSKSAYGRPGTAAQILNVAGLTGIVDYQPDELMITVRPGTRVSDVQRELQQRRQHLVFEPADWGPLLGVAPGQGTIGGMVAAAISGPRRFKAGAVRDHVLGARGVSGLGVAFACGGKVVKNVTGFDLPKLLCGAMGTLAVMSEVTLRVGPLPASETTLVFHGLDDHAAIALMRDAAASQCEISAAAHQPGQPAATMIRLEGPAASVTERARALRTELDCPAPITVLAEIKSRQMWQDVRDATGFAGHAHPLWRLLLPPNRAALAVAEISRNLPCSVLYDRAGALVWLQSHSDDAGETRIRDAVSRANGQATLFRAPAGMRATIGPFHPEPPAIGKLSETVKLAFDPLGILEPSRMVRGR